MSLSPAVEPSPPIRVLLVDNHDSYTFNLAALIELAAGSRAITLEIRTNDDPDLATIGPDDLDALVISPGPGTPLRRADVGHLPALLDRLGGTAVLGVCLGHQLLAHHLGARIEQTEPHHGHLSTVSHDGSGIFAGLSSPLTATRYHSLAVSPVDLPSALRVTARAEDGVVMGLSVAGRPWHAVQFHPESVASQHGDRLIAGFLHNVAGARG